MGEWQQKTIGDLVMLQRGIDLPSAERKSGSVPIMGSFGITGRHSEAACKGPGVTVGRSGASAGVVCYIDEDFWPLNTCLYVKDFKGNHPRFSYYLLKTFDLASLNSGSAQPSLNRNFVHPVPASFPDPPEQEAIASVLGALDDKIELNRRMNKTLEAMARAIFKDWFVDFGPTRAKMEGRAPYMAPDIWSLFPERLDDGKPEGWALRPVRDFAELRGGKQLEKERIAAVGTIPVFGGAGVMGFTDEHNADGFVISVGRVGAYCGQFFSHRGKAWINNNASLIRQHEGISGEWLFQSLRHADIEVIKKGAAQPFVSNTDVGNMPIIWPGEVVVGRFAEIVVPLMLRMEHNDAEASTLAATRDILSPKLMSGEVRVKDAENLIGEAT
ncbi:restriction endonuclease subunit S [Paracoccus sanguinis]|nr:restriction endonuclease subunit S [Paracoccus sanguinis]